VEKELATNCHHCQRRRELATVATIATNYSATNRHLRHQSREPATAATTATNSYVKLIL
jgi:hypothetical protein